MVFFFVGAIILANLGCYLIIQTNLRLTQHPPSERSYRFLTGGALLVIAFIVMLATVAS